MMPARSTRPFRKSLAWKALRLAAATAALPLALWACNSHPLEQPKPQPESQTDQYVDANPTRKLDLLFMIDNSESMEEEQTSLAKNFPSFMTELKKIPGGLPDLRVAVISSDFGAGPMPIGQRCVPLGDRGRFRVKKNCGLDSATAGYFLSARQEGTEIRGNFTGKPLEEVFACLAELGLEGCGYEHQLQVVRAALASPVKGDPKSFYNEENQNFLRPEAYLGIILVTDEDDCSADPNTGLFNQNDMTYSGTNPNFRCAMEGHDCGGKPVGAAEMNAKLNTCTARKSSKLIAVEEIANWVKSLKTTPNRIIVGGIFGWPDDVDAANANYIVAKGMGQSGQELNLSPLCVTKAGSAAPGIRMNAFVSSFGKDLSVVSNICGGDLAKPLQRIGKLIAERIGKTCVEAPIMDTNDKLPGIQPECVITQRTTTTGTGFSDKIITQCKSDTDTGICWRLQQVGGADCPASGFKIDVVKDAMGRGLPENALLGIRCRTCVKADDPRCTVPM